MKKIVIVGSVNIDTTLKVEHIPAVGETILCTDIKKSGGGKGANQAMAIALLNGDVTLVARIGCDANGDMIYDSLKKAGVDMHGVLRDDNQGTGKAYITVSDSGENNIIVYPGANYKLDCKQIDKFLSLIKGADYCVLQMEIPIETVEYVLKICKQSNVSTILNPSPAQKLDDDVLDGVDYLVPNATELGLLGKGDTIAESAKILLNKGVKNILVTLGENGCALFNKNSTRSYPAKKVVPVDTTAAGDSFLGGMVAGMADGLKVEEAVELATCTAACTILKEGAQKSLPTRSEVEKFIKNAKDKKREDKLWPGKF